MMASAPHKKKTTAKKKATTARPDEARLGRLRASLRRLYPNPSVALVHRDAFELLVATILSAQCTDERVNMVTPGLFARYPDPAALAAADPSELESIIHSTGFFRNKARSLLGASRRISEVFAGQVPATMDELLTLPGVARKTANVVLGSAYGIAAGVVVDTHVKRLSARLGLTTATQPERVERDLMALLPREDWILFSHQLILHGRQVCKARKPLCSDCVLAPDCPSAAA